MKQLFLSHTLLLLTATTLLAQNSTFTYQGRFTESSAAANGVYDLTFTLYNAANGGGTVGTSNVVNDLSVTNGVFTVVLDFGAGAFDGNDRWLQIAVRPGASSGAYTNLAPRQSITSTPYATRAANFSGSLNATQLTSGLIPLARLPAPVLTNNAIGVTLSGTLIGSGVGLSNIPLAGINGSGAITPNTNLFTLSSTPSVGAGPSALATADVNSDGKADVIFTIYSANSVTVLTNDGSGGFGLSSTHGTGLGPQSVAAADINNDGKVDLISANNAANLVWVHTNNGSGGFATSSFLNVNNGPVMVIAADVNGDGNADLISANANANTLSVLTNDGSGGFVESVSPSVGNRPGSVAAADFDGDGRLDLVSGNFFGNSLSLLTNTGGGNFAPASTLGGLSAPWMVLAPDVNSDGRPDLVCANSQSITVFTNGIGGFAVASSLNLGGNQYQIALADANRDGLIDVLSASGDTGALLVLFNIGAGRFALASTVNVGNTPLQLSTADFNGDSIADVVVGKNFNTLSVLFGNQPYIFTGRFVGDGSGLNNIVSLTADQTFTGAGIFNNASNVFTGTFFGNGAGLTGLNASQLTSGTVSDSRLPANLSRLDVNQTFSGAMNLSNTANNFVGTFNGNGAGLNSLNASQLSSGIVNDSRLPANLARLDANQTFSGAMNFSNAANNFVGTFNGNGAGLSSLNASQLTSGTVSDARLPASLARLDANQTFSGAMNFSNAANNFIGTFTGNGAGLTNVPGAVPSQLAVGTDVQMQANAQYVANNSTLTSFTLPANASIGDVAQVSGLSTGGWQVVSSSGQMLNGYQAGTVWTARGSLFNWTSLASSADGSKLVAGCLGEIHTSSDNGSNWIPRLTNVLSRSIASSADGSKLVAVGSFQFILVSMDSGTNWIGWDNARDWRSVASSADGRKLVAVAANNFIYTSTNSGTNWTPRESIRAWSAVASSADGSKLVAAVTDGQIYTSTDSGVNWTARETNRTWLSLTASADGNKLVAGTVGLIYVSTDGGTNWTARGISRTWRSVASSADGNKLIAAAWGERLHTSIDSGTNWTARGGFGPWNAVASSSDGQKLVGAMEGGPIYTSESIPLIGGQGSSVELQYAGNGIWQPVTLPASAGNVPNTSVARDSNGNFSAGTISATAFVGNGSGLTSLNASQLASGTVPDARLSANVALRTGGNTFFGNQTVTNGNLGIGTVASLYKVHVVSPESRMRLETTSGFNYAATEYATDARVWHTGTAGSGVINGLSGNYYIFDATAGAVRFMVNQNGFTSVTGHFEVSGNLYVSGAAFKPGGGSWSVASDQRLKKNIRPLAGALGKLLSVHGVNFEYLDPAKIGELSGERMGLLAQEVENVFPDWVETGTDGYKRVTVRGLEALTVEALRELRSEKDADVEKLKTENAELRARLDRLEKLIIEKANLGAE